MAKSPTKRRRAPQQEPLGDDIFQHFSAQGRSLPESPASQPEKGAPVDQTALLARIERLETQNADLLSASRRSMAAAEPRQQVRVDPKLLKVDFAGLPDPVEKPAEYQTELQTRINAAMEARDHVLRQEVQGQATQKTQADRLWEGFTKRYPGWSEHADLVGTIAQRVTEEAISQGIDPQKYMFQNTDLFYNDVNKRLEEKYAALLPKEEGEDDQLDEQPVQRQQRRRSEVEAEDGDDGRTAGIFGGQESGGRPAQGKPPAGDMIVDIHRLQRASGFL